MIWMGLGLVSGLLYWNAMKKDHSRRLTIGFLFASVFLMVCGVFALSKNWTMPLLQMVLKVLFFLAPYVLNVVSIAIILRSGNRLWKRGWSRKYGILFGLSIALAAIVTLVFLNRWLWRFEVLHFVDFLLDYFFLYLVLTFVAFVIWVASYRFIRPNTKQDYVIVLGAGLLPEGRVSRLLRYRLEEAIHFRKKQEMNGDAPAKFIVSGGQGPDEKQSEARAMRDYLVERGMPENQILLEEQSTNTHQNFLFSQFLVEKEAPRGTIFITNNFHVLRSRLYAKQLGLQVEGIGAKTPLYYLPYALLREYIALFLIFRMIHLVSVSLFLVGAVWLFWK